MEKRSENDEKKDDKMDNSEINNDINSPDYLKEKPRNVDTDNFIRKDEYNLTNINDKFHHEKNSCEKREFQIHDDEINTTENSSKKNGNNMDNLTKKEKKLININDKKVKDSNESEKDNLKCSYEKLPTVIIVIGMAGSGKTTYVSSLYNYLKIEKKKKVYTMNLDPAVKYLQYPLNIDIRDSIKYHEIMKEYKLGPNGAIMTCLNLFATRFDKVIEILEKRKHKIHYIIVDTPGQIEVFNWSASGNIILETLSVSFPVVINYVIDTVRCERPVTFMSNMLYACSVLYKSRLPFLACFNKIDIVKHDKCIEWMKNYDSFNEDILNDESYMASFSRSCALMINEFYEGIKTIGISSKTNEGFNNILNHLEYLKEEYINDYLPCIEKQMKRIKKKKEKDIKLKMESLLMEKQKKLPV